MKWILFDAYGTLLDAGKENIPQLSVEIGEKYNVSATEVFEMWSEGYFSLEKRFSLDFLTIIQANVISLSFAFGRMQLPVTDVNYWIEKLRNLWSTPKVYAGARELLESITRADPNLRFGIISNTDDDTIEAAVTHSGLPINYIMSSERARNYKPSPEIFYQSLLELGIESNDCLYIGNSVCDVIGSHNAKIKSVFINRDHKNLSGNIKPILTFDNLKQFNEYLDKTNYAIVLDKTLL